MSGPAGHVVVPRPDLVRLGKSAKGALPPDHDCRLRVLDAFRAS